MKCPDRFHTYLNTSCLEVRFRPITNQPRCTTQDQSTCEIQMLYHANNLRNGPQCQFSTELLKQKM